MSYNMSLRADSNYPPMTQSQWEEAPFNEVSLPKREFSVIASQSLSKVVTVHTEDYDMQYDEEERQNHVDTTDTSWQYAFADSNHYTPATLLKFFRDFLVQNQEQGLCFKTPAFTQHLIEECDGWIIDEEEFIEN